LARKKDDLSIESYRAKRDFTKTPEPEPRKRDDSHATSFVIHRHEARRLHYDLRLEMEGVLKSFAVPKGFSYVPEHKHLAVRTEDHPIEYLEFDGVIPKGEYGAGTMTIWDAGRYEMIEGLEGPKALAEGELKFEMFGARLRGQWHMVKTSQGENDWLLFKHRDRFAHSETEPDFPLDLTRVEPSEFPEFFAPMQPSAQRTPFSNPEWVFELRFAGERLFAEVDEDEVRFRRTDGRILDLKLREIERDFSKVRSRRALLDGVLVANDDGGRPDSNVLEQKLREGDSSGTVYYAFDLLYFERWDLRPHPLRDRKSALASILPSLETVLYVDHVSERGEELFEVIEGGGLPGVIAKRAASLYRSGASPDWLELPVSGSEEAPAGSILESLGSAPKAKRSRVKFKNREKIFWPGEGITKGDLLDYYDGIADVLLPYLRERPLHTLRYPDGIEGNSFYQKDLTGHIPDWIPTAVVREKDRNPVRYVVCNDRDTLLYLINLASIDLHPWSSRVDDLESPDWAILDLDPSDNDRSKLIRVAQHLGKVLRGAGLRPVVKTSGASGIHIYVPLKRGYTYEQARMFCEAVARMTVREHKKIATVERVVSKREDRVYIDFGQNRKEQTVVPPYIVRPVPGARVSAPLNWDELSSELDPATFTMFTMRERVQRVGDLFRGVLDDPQDLAAAIEALSAM
jgi:bifunctional non-homologous end joining protein LigD